MAADFPVRMAVPSAFQTFRYGVDASGVPRQAPILPDPEDWRPEPQVLADYDYTAWALSPVSTLFRKVTASRQIWMMTIRVKMVAMLIVHVHQ